MSAWLASGYPVCGIEGCARITDEGWCSEAVNEPCGLSKLRFQGEHPLCGVTILIDKWDAEGFFNDGLGPAGVLVKDGDTL